MEISLLNIVMVGVGHPHAEGVMEELRKPLWEKTFRVLGCVEASDELWKEKSRAAPFDNLPRFTEGDVLANNLKEGKINAVFIETGMKDLILTAQKYLAMGIPIHLDKPTGSDDQFLTLMDNAKKQKVPIQLGYVFRYNPAICAAKSYINDKKIGTICHIDAFMNTELSKDQRKILNDYTGGAMYLYGCYMLDVVLQFMGEPKTVYSFLNQTGFGQINVNDSALAFLKYEHETAVIQAIEADANGYGRRQVVIIGSQGSIEIKPLENPTKMTYAARDGQKAYQDKAEMVDLSKWSYKGRYNYMLADFVKIIRGETSQMIFPMDYEYEKKLHRLLLAAIGATKWES